MLKCFANNVKPDQKPPAVASGLSLHCLPLFYNSILYLINLLALLFQLSISSIENANFRKIDKKNKENKDKDTNLTYHRKFLHAKNPFHSGMFIIIIIIISSRSSSGPSIRSSIILRNKRHTSIKIININFKKIQTLKYR